MKRVIYFFVLICFLLVSQSIGGFTQSLPYHSFSLEDYYRKEQLLGKLDQNISFIVKPLFRASFDDVNDIFYPESNNFYIKQKSVRINGNWLNLKLLPLELIQQYNSQHPYGFNDGPMIPAKGYQTMVSGGFYAEFGPFQIQLKPEYVYAQNLDFENFSSIYANKFIVNPNTGMDIPEMFGTDSFSKMYWGQSSIRFNYKGISLGVSTENLWWGPGRRNALLMTNTAPGFKHITLNSMKPIKTKIGSFEGQIVAGRLEGSGYKANMPEDWRYINAIILSYQPRWLPGLFIGMIRSFQVYHEDMDNKLSDYFPVFIPIRKENAGGNDENVKRRDQLLSVFMRWLLTKSQAEIYFEYGRNDHAWDNRDLMLQFSHTSAYILGMSKLFPLDRRDKQVLKLIFEITQLEANSTTNNRSGGSWYKHYQVMHGYTHEGQILGSGIGPGSNLQTFSLSWVKDYKNIGLQFERFVHNNDFWYSQIKDYRSNWVDLSMAILGSWNYKNVIINFNFRFINSLNYQWGYTPKLGDPSYFWEGIGNDVFNFHAKIGLLYRF